MSILWILIGPSGSGKSTIANKIQKSNPTVEIYSYDVLRLQYYGGTYSEAWQASLDDKEFGSRSMFDFMDLLLHEKDIVVDNTNLTPKSRRPFIVNAQHNGYEIRAIIFDNPLDVLLDRQLTRTDKCVPENAVRRQYSSLVLPTLSEVDVIISANDI